MDSEITSSCGAIAQPNKSSRRNQVLSALAIAVTNMGIGTAIAYSSPAIPKFLHPTSPADGSLHLTQYQCDWFASVLTLSSAFGAILGGYLLDHLGRKLSILILSGSTIVGWILIASGQNFAMLMTGRSILGLAMGGLPFMSAAYIGEISSADIRGSLTALCLMTVTVGNMYCYGLGGVIDSWRWLAGVSGIPSVLGFLAIIFIRESPLYLLMKHKTKEARETLQHFRGKNCDIKEEFKKTEQFLEELRKTKQASIKELLLPYNLKPFGMGCVILSLVQLTGLMPIMFNLDTIFQDADTGFSDDVSSMIVSLVQVVIAVIMVVAIIDRFERKNLLVISASSTCISLAALASYFYLKEQNSEWARETLGWLPLTALIAFIISINLGLAPLQFVVLSELLSPEVRGIGGSVATTWSFLLSFTVSFVNDPMQRALGIAGTYWLYSILTFLGLIFVAYIIPETKGKTMQEIAKIFKNPAAIS